MPSKHEDDGVSGREMKLLIQMVQDLKQDFKDHAANVYTRLNALNCGDQNTRITMVESRVEELELAPEKRATALVAWGGLILSVVTCFVNIFKK